MTQMNLTCPFDELSNTLLDSLLSEVFSAAPSARTCFLAECGGNIHAASVRVLFRNITIQDDARMLNSLLGASHTGPIAALMQNPSRYATAVRSITIVDPTIFSSSDLSSSSVFSFGEDSSSEDISKTLTEKDFQPIATSQLEWVLRVLRNLESFNWKASTLPPDGLCEILSSHNLRLTSFTYLPKTNILPTSATGLSPLKWDAPSLPMLSALNITRLEVSRLSQVGARAFAHLLSLIEDDPTLDSASVDISWLDDGLCALIGKACRKARRLQIGSEGTRLGDKGIISILDTCEHLEEFALVDAQGRLSKTLWGRVEEFPPLLRKLNIAISESSVQHSWAIDHLSGLHAIPMNSFTHLTIVRVIRPFDSHVSELASIKTIPTAFVDSFKDAFNLEVLECDWWSWRPEDLKVPLETCSVLRRLKVAFDAPFVKLFTMAAAFSSASRLETLEVFIPVEHCPALPPSPSMSVYSHVYGSTPGTSPVMLQKPLPGSLGPSDSVPDDRSSPPRTTSTTDPHVPPLRDIRKFVRRCAVIQELNWYGKNGRGQWIVSRPTIPTTPSKISSNVTVEHILPSPAIGHGLTAAIWERVRQEEEATRVGWTPARVDRDGAEWVGVNAELYRSARATEKEKEEQAVKEEKAARAAAKRATVTALDTNIPRTPKVEREQSEALAGYRQSPSSPVSPYQPTKEVPTPSSPKLGRRRVSGPAAVGIGGGGGEGQGCSRAQSQGAAEAILYLSTRLDGTKASTNGNNGQGKGLRRASGSSKSNTNGPNGIGNGRPPTLNVPKRPSTGGGTPKKANNGGNDGLGNRRLSGDAPNSPVSIAAGRGRARKSAF